MQRMMQLRRYYLLFLVCTKQEVFCQSNIHWSLLHFETKNQYTCFWCASIISIGGKWWGYK
jgi:hypothetical protein